MVRILSGFKSVPSETRNCLNVKTYVLTWKSSVAFTLSSFHHAGVNRLSDHLEEMTGNRPNIVFRLCWKFLSPLLILVSQQTLYIIQTLYQNNEFSFHCRHYMSNNIVLKWLSCCRSSWCLWLSNSNQPVMRMSSSHLGLRGSVG